MIIILFSEAVTESCLYPLWSAPTHGFKMLYIFSVEQGTMLTFEMDYACQRYVIESRVINTNREGLKRGFL